MLTLEDVLERHGAILGRVLAGYSRPGAERQDLAQELAVALLLALPRLREENALRTFVVRVAHHVGLQHVARERTRRRRESALLNENGQDLDLLDASPGPEASLGTRQAVERLAAAIRKVPIGARQALLLSLEGFDNAEIAEMLGLDANTVGVRLHRARGRLREILDGRHA